MSVTHYTKLICETCIFSRFDVISNYKHWHNPSSYLPPYLHTGRLRRTTCWHLPLSGPGLELASPDATEMPQYPLSVTACEPT